MYIQYVCGIHYSYNNSDNILLLAVIFTKHTPLQTCSFPDWLISITQTSPSSLQAPCPPRPLLLHLGLTAHTHSLTDYTQLCGSLERFHIAPHTQYHTEEEEGAVLRMKTEERDLILSILREMTRCVCILYT